MASAKKLPSGNWRVRVYVGRDESGKSIFESFTASTKREAERQAAVWNADRKNRERALCRSGMTVGTAIDQYIESCRVRGLSPTTIKLYLGMARKSFPTLVGLRISSVTFDDVQRALYARAKDHSGKTIRNEFTFLLQVLDMFRPDLDMSKLVYAKVTRPEIEIPDDDGMQAFMAAAKASNTDFYLAVLLASILGLRRSEICALEWADLDTVNHTISITKALVKDENRDWVIKGTKSRAGTRVKAVPDALYKELLSLRSLNKLMVNLTPDAITRRHERLVEKCPIPCSFHGLRHYNASVQIALGIPLPYIAAEMGHASTDMVERVYGHIMDGKRKAVAVQMDRFTDSILAGKSVDYTNHFADTNVDTPKRKINRYKNF